MAKKLHVSKTLPRIKGRFSKRLQDGSDGKQPVQAPKLGDTAETVVLAPLTSPAPFGGRPAVPYISTFQSLVQSISGKKVLLNPDEAVRQSRLFANQMRLDLAVKAPLEERFRATALAPWHIEPANKHDPDQVEMANGLTKIVNRIPNFTKYRLWLMEGVFFGRVAIDNVWSWVFDGPDQYIGITDWLPVHGDKLVWTDDGKVGVRIGANYPAWMAPLIETSVEGRAYFLDDYTRSKFVIHSGAIEDGQFEDVRSAGARFGIGLRSYIYWAWWLKQQAQGWALDALERFGSGFTVWFFEQGNPESEKMVRAAAEAQSNQNAILFPRSIGNDKEGAGIQRIDMSGTGLTILRDMIRDYFDAQIKGYIIGQNLSSESAATGLGSGVSDFQQETKSQVIRLDAINLGETLTTELLVPLARFAWPGRECRCKFVIDTDKPNPKALLEAAKIFVELGGEVDEDHLRSQLGLPKPEEGAKVLKKAAPPAAPAIPPPISPAASPLDALSGKP